MAARGGGLAPGWAWLHEWPTPSRSPQHDPPLSHLSHTSLTPPRCLLPLATPLLLPLTVPSIPTRYTLKKVVSGPSEYTAKGQTVKAHAFTSSARAAIEANGGTCVILPKTAPDPDSAVQKKKAEKASA